MICKAKFEWDDNLSGEVLKSWTNFVQVVSELREIRIPRLTSVTSVNITDKIELHRFSDSSNSVYCGVVYLRVVSTSSVRIFFISSKSRVAPLKKLAIPR